MSIVFYDSFEDYSTRDSSEDGMFRRRLGDRGWYVWSGSDSYTAASRSITSDLYPNATNGTKALNMVYNSSIDRHLPETVNNVMNIGFTCYPLLGRAITNEFCTILDKNGEKLFSLTVKNDNKSIEAWFQSKTEVALLSSDDFTELDVLNIEIQFKYGADGFIKVVFNNDVTWQTPAPPATVADKFYFKTYNTHHHSWLDNFYIATGEEVMYGMIVPKPATEVFNHSFKDVGTDDPWTKLQDFGNNYSAQFSNYIVPQSEDAYVTKRVTRPPEASHIGYDFITRWRNVNTIDKRKLDFKVGEDPLNMRVTRSETWGSHYVMKMARFIPITEFDANADTLYLGIGVGEKYI